MSEENRSLSPTARGVIALLIIALAITAGFALYQRTSARQLRAQNEQMVTALKDTQGQMQALADKVNALATPPAPARAVAAPRTARHVALHRRPKDDPRWKKVQSQLDEQGKQIEATRQDLTGARTELSGSIARTHEEVVALQRKGERNYYEFDLDKSKQFRAEGPVGIRVKKVNPKHQFADLELRVDDMDVSQKHVNIYQPVMFYAEQGGQPVEIVVNRMSKNHVHGYVSAPKYQGAELATMAPAVDSGRSASAPAQNGARRKLPLPQ